MKIINYYLKNNDCYKLAKKITPKGIILHSVGCSQEEPTVFCKSFDKPNLQKCVHAFVGAGVVYQTLPLDYKAWHCGLGSRGSYNSSHIGIEMCEPNTIKYTSSNSFIDIDPIRSKAFIAGTLNTAIEYIVYLCNILSIDPSKSGSILSHHEAYLQGYATNHSDPEHLLNYAGISMDTIRQRIILSHKNNINMDKNINVFDKTDDKIKCKEQDYKNYLSDQIKKAKDKFDLYINDEYKDADMINVDGFVYVRLRDMTGKYIAVDFDKQKNIITLSTKAK